MGDAVARKSLNRECRAIDMRLPGVGSYPLDQLVQMDTGRVRNK